MNAGVKTRLKMLLAVAAVFVLGCVTGASLDSLYRLQAASGGQNAQSSQPGKEDFFEALRSNLELNNRQATEIRSIVDQTRGEYRQLRAEVRPRYDAIRQRARVRIRALLTPDQLQKFDAMVAQRDARRDQEEKDKH
jgi:hypothetical protein